MAPPRRVPRPAMIRRTLANLRADRQPLMTRQSYRHELITSGMMPLSIAMVEAGVVGVIAKRVFDVGDLLLAVFTAAPMFSMLTSMVWAKLARGRPKVQAITRLQIALLVIIAAIAVLPVSVTGGYLLAALFVAARCLMAGVITVRSAVWRANYPRRVRGQITANLSVVATMVLVATSLIAAVLLDTNTHSFRAIYPAAALLASVGVIAYSRIRVRRERDMLAFENRPTARPTPHGDDGPIYEYDANDSGGFWQVLKRDATFRSYMTWQFMLGGANMMVEAPVIKIAAESSEQIEPIRLGDAATMSVGFIIAIGLTQAIPITLAMMTVGRWGRLLDRVHIARFRAQQGWMFVVAHLCAALAAWLITDGQLMWGLIALAGGRVLQGVARGGGMIAWNLGHNDFASRRMVAVYMGIHMTLTGVRGAVFPFLGMALYAGLPPFTVPLVGWNVPGFDGLGFHAFVIAAALGTCGTLGFYTLSRRVVGADELYRND